jgi:hypothetical protein
MVRALAGENAARKLAVGQPCLIRLGGPQELGASGAIVALHPDAAANPPAGSARGTVAWIALAVDSPDSPLFALTDDTEATVTVLLREALSPVNAGSAPPPSAAPAPSSVVPAGQLPSSAAAPPSGAGPENGENSFGEGPAPVREGQAHNSPPAPPVVRAGSPAAAGRAALSDAPQAERQSPLPSLPPLEAPERLTGSPLPDPRNNPSLITPEILENAATAPR